MELIIPEILLEARQLSVPLILLGWLVGLVLWLIGWWSHRFWVTLSATVIAGIIGLYEAPLFQLQPLVAAMLLALATGMLALALMRLAAFALAGVACVALVKLMAPSVEAGWICFLSGGIVATILFRLWLMVLTSFGGTLLMEYCALCFLDYLAIMDCVRMGQEHAIFLNWVCAIGTALGAFLQFYFHRRNNRKKDNDRHSSHEYTAEPVGLIGRFRLPMPFRRAA